MSIYYLVLPYVLILCGHVLISKIKVAVRPHLCEFIVLFAFLVIGRFSSSFFTLAVPDIHERFPLLVTV